jgi:peptide/nickel transport system substrate-binding protein
MDGREVFVISFIFQLISNIILLQVPTLAQSEIRDEGDWLVWASRIEPKTLNPIIAENDVYCRWITRGNIFEPLLVYDFDTLKLKPWLAKSYNVSDDGLEITFQLKDNIHFSDGAPVTADDVIFTYQTITNPDIDAANIASQYVNVDRVICVDQRAVKFIMKRPYFKALQILSFWDVGILPKHIYQFNSAAQFNKRISNPVGSGPYAFQKWDTGREIVLSRNENYWGDKPKLKKIIYKFITNPLACIQVLRSHEADIIIPEPEQFANFVKDQKFLEEFYCLSYWNPGVPFFYIGWNMDTPFFCDQRVRLAMTHIINRKLIIQHLLDGNGYVITGPFYAKGSQNDPNVEPWPFDTSKAEELLDKAGWIDSNGDGLRDKDGTVFRFRFMYSSDSALYSQLARFLKDEAAKVGIVVVPDPLEWSVILSRLTNRQFEAYVASWAGEIIEDPYKLFHSSQIGTSCNYVGFRNPKADAIIEQYNRTIEDSERSQLCHQLHRILHEEQPYTFLFTRPSFRFIDRRFKNVTIHKLGVNFLEWYVPRDAQRYK